MAARAIWKGELKLNSTKLLVKLYSAVEDKSVRFHILDDRARKRVKQHMVMRDSGEAVPNEEIQKGTKLRSNLDSLT
jgi:DNA end-binding protein Ku